jgi:hypothetical protein
LLLTTFSRASASENVPEAERPNGRVAEGRAARMCGGAFNNVLVEVAHKYLFFEYIGVILIDLYSIIV